jgi:O-antigen/teichoic acid export membrane protein
MTAVLQVSTPVPAADAARGPLPPVPPTRGAQQARILRNVGSNWAGIVVGIVTSFFVAPIVVNSLGNVYYGIWTLIMQFTGYVWLFDFGVRESVIKYVAQYHAAAEHERVRSTVTTALSVYSVVAAVAMVGVAGVAFGLPYFFNIPDEAITAARTTAVLTGATIAMGLIFNVFVGVLMGLQQFYRLAWLGIGLGLIRTVVVVTLLWSGHGIVALALTQFVMSLFSGVLIYRRCCAELPYLSFRLVRPERGEVLKLFHYGKYVLLSNVGDKLVFATDSIVVAMFMPISMLTYYAIGGTLIDHFRSFVRSFGSILNPLSSSLEARKETDALRTLLLSSTKATMLLGLPVCIGFILLGETFINLWMGPAYGPLAGAVVAVLAVGYLIGLPYYTILGVLYGLGQHRVIALSRLVEGVSNIALSILLVKRYGLVGVALGTVIPHILIVGGYLPLVLPRFVRVSPRTYFYSTYARPFLSALPFWFACWAIAKIAVPSSLPALFGWGAMAMIVYAVPSWFVALSSKERAHVREAVRRRVLRRAVAVS